MKTCIVARNVIDKKIMNNLKIICVTKIYKFYMV